MKNQLKLIITTFILIVVTILTSYYGYQKSQSLHQEFIEKTIDETVKKVKFDINKADTIIELVSKFKENLFRSIHKSTIKTLQENSNIDLKSLKKQIDAQLPGGDIQSQLYLINKDYIVYDTTYEKDKGLDMKLFRGAVEDIKLAYEKAPNIVIASPSIDVLNKEYRIYSYGVVDKEKKVLLEIGFFDNSISKLKQVMLKNSTENSMVESIDIFGDYQSYIINLIKDQTILHKTKQGYLKYLASTINSPENQIIQKVGASGKQYSKVAKEGKKKIKIVYSTIKHIKVSQNGYKNYVVRVKFDITQYHSNLQNMKFLFLFSSVFLLILFLVYFNFLKQSIISPLDNKIKDQFEDLQLLNENLERKVKKQVESITASQKQFELIFETGMNGIAIIDLESNFLLVNSAYEKIVGMTKEDLYKTSCIKMTIPEMVEESKQVVETVLQQGYYKGYEKQCITSNGKVIDVIMDLVLMPNRKTILLIINDITQYNKDKKEKERQVQQLFHQSRLAQMGEMISMIAHQWRQPLNAISLTSSNLQFKLMMDDVDNEFFTKEMKLIDSYSQHLSKTIDDFRGFFKEKKEKEAVTLDQIVNSTLDIVQKSVENRNIKIVTDLKFHEEFETYASEIKQVLLNLIKNSEDILLEKERENPTIIIQTLYNEFTTKIELIVKDNAGGIPDNIVGKIFEPYFSTKLEKDGTGLGLYMSKTIIEDHCRGKLSASNDTNGAVFKIELDSKIED